MTNKMRSMTRHINSHTCMHACIQNLHTHEQTNMHTHKYIYTHFAAVCTGHFDHTWYRGGCIRHNHTYKRAYIHMYPYISLQTALDTPRTRDTRQGEAETYTIMTSSDTRQSGMARNLSPRRSTEAIHSLCSQAHARRDTSQKHSHQHASSINGLDKNARPDLEAIGEDGHLEAVGEDECDEDIIDADVESLQKSIPGNQWQAPELQPQPPTTASHGNSPNYVTSAQPAARRRGGAAEEPGTAKRKGVSAEETMLDQMAWFFFNAATKLSDSREDILPQEDSDEQRMSVFAAFTDLFPDTVQELIRISK